MAERRAHGTPRDHGHDAVASITSKTDSDCVSFVRRNWCDLEWSPWIQFDGPRARFRAFLPSSAGVYRIRPVGLLLLAYLGQTGRNLRERLLALRDHAL